MDKRLSRLLAILTVICGALIIIAVSSFAAPCDGMITLKNGMKMHMKCYWTGRVFIVLGALIILNGLIHIFAYEKETHRYLGIMEAGLAIAALFIPTSKVIGICQSNMADCKHMVNIVRIIDIIVLIIGVLFLVWPYNSKRRENLMKGGLINEYKTKAR